MTTLTVSDLVVVEELDEVAMARIAGGMIPVYEGDDGNKGRPGASQEGTHHIGGLGSNGGKAISGTLIITETVIPC